MKRSLLVLAIAALLALASVPAGAKPEDAGFLTNQAAMLRGVANGVKVKPIVTVGETMPGGLVFQGIPDGIAVDPRGTNQLDIYVNHELSLVPFQNVVDPINSTLDLITLKRGAAKIVGAEVVIPSTANFQRFCSNYFWFADGEPLIFTNEEATDFVNRTGVAWPAGPGAEQAGLVVAYDPGTGEYQPIYGMGRHNHENAVAVDGFDDAVILSGDDTFTAPSSQMYLYKAADRDAVWNDQGALYAFVATNAAENDYGDIAVGESLTGSFIEVPRAIAIGDQTGLEDWSNANNVFQFIRIEDIATDRHDSNVVYFADTGEPRAIPSATSGRLARAAAGTLGPYPNGRIFKMVLDPDNPLVVDSLSILIDGDAAGYNVVDVIHQPDNIETTASSLLIQEDPGSHNSYPADDANGVNARIWQYSFASGELRVVAEVDQALMPAARKGSWESSGIVDVSQYFGAGAFLVDIQAHGLFVGPTSTFPHPTTGVTQTVRTEGGQLLLIRIPGA